MRTIDDLLKIVARTDVSKVKVLGTYEDGTIKLSYTVEGREVHSALDLCETKGFTLESQWAETLTIMKQPAFEAYVCEEDELEDTIEKFSMLTTPVGTLN